jgi:multisubunit Na+/H+ antiporter MnhG subunit
LQVEEQIDGVSFGRRLLNGWMVVAGRFGSIQTLLLLVLFYIVLIGPVSVVQAIGRRDHLDKRAMWKKETAWRESESSGTDLERAKLLS